MLPTDGSKGNDVAAVAAVQSQPARRIPASCRGQRQCAT